MRPTGVNHHNFKHGKSQTRTYHKWKHMRQRCLNPKDHKYIQYGGRGITICKRWDCYNNFLSDMGECPAGKTLDRIDNNGHYSPANCRWATLIQQQNNTTRNHYITHNGTTLTIAEWSRLTGIGYKCLWKRVKDGWSFSRALGVPVAEQRIGQKGLFE